MTPELSKTSDGAISRREDAASQSFAQLLRQDRQYRAFRGDFSLLERCPVTRLPAQNQSDIRGFLGNSPTLAAGDSFCEYDQFLSN